MPIPDTSHIAEQRPCLVRLLVNSIIKIYADEIPMHRYLHTYADVYIDMPI